MVKNLAPKLKKLKKNAFFDKKSFEYKKSCTFAPAICTQNVLTAQGRERSFIIFIANHILNIFLITTAHHKMSKYSYLTREGYDKLKAELDDLKAVERPKAARQIAEAREKGDLSENAEYDAAKEAQGLLEFKISQMEAILANSRVLNEEDLDLSSVVVLSSVDIKNVKTGKNFTYTLVSETEADLKLGKISVTSPIGKGLLGKKIGEVATISTPAGTTEFEILNIFIK